MKYINELREILSAQLPMDKRKIECLVQFMLGLISLRTVNLALLADSLQGKAKSESKYRRLQRLIAEWPLNTDWLGAWLLSWFFDANDKLSLAMDRTNWKLGKVNINFLVVAVVYRGMAIPIIWTLLPKQGNSNFSERKKVIERTLRFVKKDRISNLLCDREFVGKRWFKWLQTEGIPFKIRIKHNYLTQTSTGKETTVSALFYDLPRGHKRALQTSRLITGVKVYLTGSRLESGELMVVASLDEQGCAIEQYCERWEIETLFENLKSRGFNFESTHITTPERLSALMGIVTLAACWAYRAGEWRVDQGELVMRKKHGRPARSLFRHGLDAIRSRLLQMNGWKMLKPFVRLWGVLQSPIPLVAL